MVTKQAGILKMPENDLNRIDYILNDNRTAEIRSFNITKLFEEYENSFIGLVIHYKDCDLFCEEGYLYHHRNEDWMINGISIDYKLWDYEGKLITIIIDDMGDIL